MATVIFSSELQRLTGEERTEVAAKTYRELLDQVTARYPSLDRQELMGMAVAIDGEIIHDPLLETVRPASEVHFLYRISGG
ncbi:MAG TPA: MoaD/ThiS family protein [Pseudomonadales bacterium]|nr:MoaD/ThiS family protein [Pseudomonadales bacterium]